MKRGCSNREYRSEGGENISITYGEYRKDVMCNELQVQEIIEDGGRNYGLTEKYLSKDEVEEVVDNIERDVNEIKDLLDDISGLTEIEEIKDKIKNLSDKLF